MPLSSRFSIPSTGGRPRARRRTLPWLNDGGHDVKQDFGSPPDNLLPLEAACGRLGQPGVGGAKYRPAEVQPRQHSATKRSVPLQCGAAAPKDLVGGHLEAVVCHAHSQAAGLAYHSPHSPTAFGHILFTAALPGSVHGGARRARRKRLGPPGLAPQRKKERKQTSPTRDGGFSITWTSCERRKPCASRRPLSALPGLSPCWYGPRAHRPS